MVPHFFALAERDGEPCGIALITRSSARYGPVPIRRLHIGTAGEPAGEGVYVEYNRLLAAPGARADFARELMLTLGRDRGWHELRLDGFAAGDAEALLDAEPRLSADRVPSPSVDLRPARHDHGDALALMSSGTRGRIRRSLRHFGQVESEWAETPGHGLDILDELSRLHQRRWTGAGEAGAFSSARFAGFHRDLAERLVGDRVMLFRARAGSTTLGCLYGFVERGRLLFYQSGLESFDDNRLKPGLVVHALCMQACLERGLDEYDFLAGESRYKRELSTVERQLVWASLRRGSVRWHAIDWLRALRGSPPSSASP